MKILKRIFIILNIIAAILLVLCYFAPVLDPEKYPAFAGLGLILSLIHI